MSLHTDKRYLREEQYSDAANLSTRIQLHTQFSTEEKPWHEWVFEQVCEVAGAGRVLELGCGRGELWRQNSERIPESWQVVLSDFSAGMLEDARAHLAAGADFAAADRFRFEHFDAETIPHAESSFDLVIANQMLYHVPDRDTVYAEVRRVLVQGGYFCAATGGQNSMSELRDLVHDFDPAIAYRVGYAQAGFTLENGGEQLARYFSEVDLRRHDGALQVTEAEPLLRYILSGGERWKTIRGERREALGRFIAERIKRDGAIHISKDGGLFLANKGA